MLLVNGTSGIVQSQLVPVAPPQAMFPPAALQPVMGQGAFANNLPAGGSIMGGSTGSQAATTSGQTGGAVSAESSIGAVASDMSKLPFWKQPIFLTIALLVIGLALLRYVHWS
jgi:hypothetical protein